MNQKTDSIRLNKNDSDSLYYWIANKISSHEFRSVLKNFIDENCKIFFDDDKNTSIRCKIFNEMKILVENLLNSVLKEGNITEEDYKKASQRGKTDIKYKKYFIQIEKFKQYPFFKSLMVKRNQEIHHMKEKQMNLMENNQIDNNENQKIDLTPELLAKLFENDMEIKEAIKKFNNNNNDVNTEDEDMKLAIKLSLEQYQKEKEEREKEEKFKKKNIQHINSIIGFEISAEEDVIKKNRPEIKNKSNKVESKISSIKVEPTNSQNSNDIYLSSMPAPINNSYTNKEVQNNETLKKSRLVVNNIYEEHQNENKYNSPFSNILEDNKLDRVEQESNLEKSHENSNEDNYKNDHNGYNNKESKVYYLPGSINENNSEYM